MKTIKRASKGMCSCCKQEYLVIVSESVVCQLCDAVNEWPIMKFSEEDFKDNA